MLVASCLQVRVGSESVAVDDLLAVLYHPRENHRLLAFDRLLLGLLLSHVSLLFCHGQLWLRYSKM